MAEEQGRKKSFVRNERLEKTLTQLSKGLEGAEDRVECGSLPPYPPIFIIGAPRSGTTLLLQWLARSNRLSYPSNFLSRFYAAPYMGALVHDILLNQDCDYRGELSDIKVSSLDFSSDVGKTSGALAPNEFWYWWRRFIPNEEPRALSGLEISKVDGVRFRRSLSALQTVWLRPFVAKGIILQYNLELLQSIFPNALFVHTRRDLFYNAQSLLLTRERFYGERTRWFSVKPPGWQDLIDETPEAQVVGQVALTVESITRQFELLPRANTLTIAHERFCAQPQETWHFIREKLHILGFPLAVENTCETHFSSHEELRVDEKAERAIREACTSWQIRIPSA